jgi:Flp pilus assembly protein TadD
MQTFANAIMVLTLLAGMPLSALSQADPYQPDVPAAAARELERARSLRSHKQAEEAVKVLRQVLAAKPDYFLARYELGVALTETSEGFTSAIPELEKAAALKRRLPAVQDAHVFNTLGWAYLSNSQTKLAARAFKEAEALPDQLSENVKRRLYNNMGYLYLTTGERDLSEKYLRAADQLGSEQAKLNLKTLEAIRRRDAALVKKEKP